MAKNYKKGVYTLPELGDIIFKKCPGRFKNRESAGAMVRKVARALNIGDINGKQRFRFITATDADRIVQAILNTPSKKQKAEQISLFDKNIKWLDWLDDYTPDTKKEEAEPEAEPEEETEALAIPKGWTQEQAEAVAEFWKASMKLAEVFNIGEGKA